MERTSRSAAANSWGAAKGQAATRTSIGSLPRWLSSLRATSRRRRTRGGVLGESLAGRRRPHRATLHEPLPDLELEGRHLLRDGRLGVTELSGGGGERPAANDSQQGA